MAEIEVTNNISAAAAAANGGGDESHLGGAGGGEGAPDVNMTDIEEVAQHQVWSLTQFSL